MRLEYRQSIKVAVEDVEQAGREACEDIKRLADKMPTCREDTSPHERFTPEVRRSAKFGTLETLADRGEGLTWRKRPGTTAAAC